MVSMEFWDIHCFLQCRMQIQGTDSLVPNFRRYKSPLDCAVQTVKNEGVRNSRCYNILGIEH